MSNNINEMTTVYNEISTYLDRYYDTNTPNTSRLEIANYLEAFMERNDSLIIALEFFKNSTSKYVQLFSISVFEKNLNQKWHLISQQEKNIFKVEIIKMIFFDTKNTYKAMASQLCKIFVLIGKNEFRNSFQDFFKMIDDAANDGTNFENVLKIMDYLFDEITNDSGYILSSERLFLINTCKVKCQPTIEKLITRLSVNLKNIFRSSPLSAHSYSNSPQRVDNTQRSFSPLNFSLPVYSPINEESDSVKLSSNILYVLVKYLKLFPSNLALNLEFISTVIEFAGVPFNSQFSQEKQSIASVCVTTLVEIVTYETIIIQNSQIIDLIYQWSKTFLSKVPEIQSQYIQFVKNCSYFFELFIPIFCNRYLLQHPFDVQYVNLYLKFILSLNSSEQTVISTKSTCKLTKIVKTSKKIQPQEISLIMNILSEFTLNLLKKILFKYKQEFPILTDLNEDTEQDILRNISSLIVELPNSINASIVNLYLFEIDEITKIYFSIKQQNQDITMFMRNMNSDSKKQLKNLSKDFWKISTLFLSFYQKIQTDTNEFLNSKPFEIWESSYKLRDILITFFLSSQGDKNMENDSVKELVIKCYDVIGSNIQITCNLLKDPFNFQTNSQIENLQSSLVKITTHEFSKSLEVLNAKLSVDYEAAKLITTILENSSLEILSQSFNINDFLEKIRNMTYINTTIKTASLISCSGLNIIFKDISSAQKSDIARLEKDSQLIINLYEKYFVAFVDVSNRITQELSTNSLSIQTITLYSCLCEIFSFILFKIQQQNVAIKKQSLKFFTEIFKQSIKNIDRFFMHQKLLKSTLKIVKSEMLTYKDFVNEGCAVLLGTFSNFLNYLKTGSLNVKDFEKKLLLIIKYLMFILEQNISSNMVDQVVKIISKDLFQCLVNIKSEDIDFEFCKIVAFTISNKFDHFAKSKIFEVKSSFHELFEILMQNLTIQNLETIKECLMKFNSMDEVRNIYANPIFQENQLLMKLLVQFFSFLFVQELSNIHEDIVNNFYRVAIKNFEIFYFQIIPFILSNIPSINNTNIEFLQKSIQPVQDHPSFCSQLINLAKDAKYFSTINSPFPST